VDPDLNPDTDPDPAFQVNPDPDPGFWWPKIEKNTDEICFPFFNRKLRFTYSQALIKDGQATGEASASKTSSTSKHEILKLFSIFRAIFALLDLYPDCESGYGSRDLY
jgi:hypothetical protein